MKGKFIMSGILAFVFFLLMGLIKTVDVAAIGPKETEVGFSHLNQSVNEFFGYHESFYNITEVLGVLALGLVGVFALVGLIQWIKRKNMLKVDSDILVLGGLYIIVGIVYLIFLKVAISYRPIMMDGEVFPEPSFPSSHTVLAFIVFGSAMYFVKKYFGGKSYKNILQGILIILCLLAVVLRLLSGVHWFTDIIGGVVFSFSLLFLFGGMLDKFKEYRD